MQDPCDERWWVVLQGKTVGVNVEDNDSYMDTYVSPLTAQITGNVVSGRLTLIFLVVLLSC